MLSPIYSHINVLSSYDKVLPLKVRKSYVDTFSNHTECHLAKCDWLNLCLFLIWAADKEYGQHTTSYGQAVFVN